MSLSDNDQFEPLAINTLEQFEEESSKDPDEVDPDFDRFKSLFDEPKFKEDESDGFKAAYEFKKEHEEIVFKALIEDDEDNAKRSESSGASDNESQSDEPAEPEEPELTPEEKGFQEGLEKGIEQGFAEGKEQGHEEGFKKGEEDGFKKGEEDGKKSGHEQGFEQGLKEGEQKGEAQAKQAVEQLLVGLEGALETADQTLDVMVDKYEGQIVSLIGHIAKKIIMTQIELDDEIVKPMILDALKTLVQPEEIILTVSLDDYEYIEMVKDEFFEQIESLTSVSVKTDPSLQKGSFGIETNTAMLSSDVETQLDAIVQAMKSSGGE